MTAAPLRIVADENIPLVEPFFSPLGEIARVDGRTLRAEQVADADLLLVRSVTRVGPELLRGSNVRYVASATIGTDHIDRGWLAEQRIGFDNAPGCNAESVVDYVISSLVNLAQQQGCRLGDKRVGIVGVGNVGSRLAKRLQALNIDCRLCDPPRAEREGTEGFYSLSQLLSDCDLFCLHTPLIKDGEHPSYHLFDSEVLEALPEGAWVINAGRGEVIDNRALLACLQRRKDLQVVLDVWEPEPQIDPALFPLLNFGTPHIAGYSLEGRTRGTEMIYRSACSFLGIAAQQRLASLLPPAGLAQVCVDQQLLSAQLHEADGQLLDSELVRRLVKLVYDPRRDHDALRRVVQGESDRIGTGFDQLRRNYPQRREFSSVGVCGLDADRALARQLGALGFRVDG